MLTVLNVQYEDAYRLRVELSDGSVGVVDVGPLLWGPVFEQLKDPVRFRDVRLIKEFGTVGWENGADIAPEWLRDHLIVDTRAKVAEKREQYG